jgi:DNA-binding NarL/FixJ family response regulator
LERRAGGGYPLKVAVVGGDDLDARIVARELDRDGIVAEVELAETDRLARASRAPVFDVVVVRRAEPSIISSLSSGMRLGCIVAVVEGHSAGTTRAALEAGADAVIAAEGWVAAIAPVIRVVRTGVLCIPSEARELLHPPPALSLRERQVLALVAVGLTNAQIADRLFLYESTVKTHITAAFRRLGVHSRREAIAVLAGSGESLRRAVLELSGETRAVGDARRT